MTQAFKVQFGDFLLLEIVLGRFEGYEEKDCIVFLLAGGIPYPKEGTLG